MSPYAAVLCLIVGEVLISAGDFEKKQIVFVFFNQGEKLSFSNDNFIVRASDGSIKFQCTCYRLFLVFAIGFGSITSGLIQRAKKFGFSIVMMTQGLRPYQNIGFTLEGNTLLRKTQYEYESIDLAKHITKNKIRNQRIAIMNLRNKNEKQLEAASLMQTYISKVQDAKDLNEIMGIEGCAAKLFFPNYFSNIRWMRRAPRTKCDMVNALLDIGYTILFSFVDALLNCYGFDVYCGVMHRNFYMRKSLVCDIVEPFRCLIEEQIRKAINLKQCKEEDFIIDNGRYMLRWEKNAEYISWIAKPIIIQKSNIHKYVQSFYRSFMKHRPAEEFPEYLI